MSIVNTSSSLVFTIDMKYEVYGTYYMYWYIEMFNIDIQYTCNDVNMQWCKYICIYINLSNYVIIVFRQAVLLPYCFLVTCFRVWLLAYSLTRSRTNFRMIWSRPLWQLGKSKSSVSRTSTTWPVMMSTASSIRCRDGLFVQKIDSAIFAAQNNSDVGWVRPP